jgi:putative peptidoglycan lipid II flippase
MFFTRSLFKATAIISFFGLLSRFVGLYRDRILASQFGPSDILDVYYVSFGLPDLIFNLLVVGSLASAFIPKFIQYKSESPEKSFRLANNFLNILVVAVSISAALIIIFAEPLVSLIGPGFEGSKKDLAVLFLRVMALSPVIFSISLVFGSVLQSYKSFVSYSIAPIFYNVGIIIGSVVLVPLFGPLGLAEGVVLGALLHLGIQIPELLKLGYRWSPILNIKDPGVREIFLRMIPRSIGLAAQQMNWIFVNAFATTFFIGGPAIMNLANNLQYLPIALVGISLAVASFPNLSELGLSENKKPLWKAVQKNCFAILALVIPVSIACYFFSERIVELVLGVGVFKLSDVSITAQALKYFMFGVPAAAIVPVLARGFYAAQNSVIPMMAGVISITFNVVFIYAFKAHWGFMILPLGIALAANINAAILIGASLQKYRK